MSQCQCAVYRKLCLELDYDLLKIITLKAHMYYLFWIPMNVEFVFLLFKSSQHVTLRINTCLWVFKKRRSFVSHFFRGFYVLITDWYLAF